jgi:hypothetical protein
MPNSEPKDLAAELEVVAGNPTDTELAAVIAVLRDSSSATSKAQQAEPNWAKGPQMLRDSQNTGDLEWRSDFKGEI